MAPGSKVVCIDDSPSEVGYHFQNWVVEGKEYTIRRIEGSIWQGQRVLLEEIRNKPIFIAELGSKCEPGFSIKRFRALNDLQVSAQVEETEHLEV